MWDTLSSLLVAELSVLPTVAALLVLAVAAWLWHVRAVPLSEKSGVGIGKFTPWFGHVRLLAPNVDRLHDWFHEAFERTNFKGFWLSTPLRPPVIFLACRPDVMEHVLKTNFDNYIKPPDAADRLREVLGHGIFQVDGSSWRAQRKVASHMFSLRSLREDMYPVFVKHAAVVVQKLTEARASRSSIDMEDTLFHYTLGAFSETAFGNVSGDDDTFAKAFDVAQSLTAMRFQDRLWPVKRFFNIGTEREIAAATKQMNAYAYKAIKLRRQAVDRSKRPDLLSRFITHFEERKEEVSDEYLRDIMVNFLIAGRDTTATLLTWTLIMLSEHREVEQRLLESLARVREKHNLQGLDMPYTALKDLHYAEAVLFETLRLYPSVPLDVKCAVGDDVLPDGTFVPKGVKVLYSPFSMGRCPSVWPDPMTYRPERWLAEDGTMGPAPSQYKFIAFNAGPRLCLGKRLAIMEAKLLLSKIVPDFRFALCPGHDRGYMRSLILRVRSGCYMKVTERANCLSA